MSLDLHFAFSQRFRKATMRSLANLTCVTNGHFLYIVQIVQIC